MAENIYNWQFNCIPGNANQGAILLTRDDIQRPPFAQDDFIWKAMEDVIGVANCKLEYDEEHNLYKIYKAKGHQDNNGNWSYTWEQFGSWEALTEEVAQALRDLIYVSYDFVEATEGGLTTLKMYGIRKNGNRDLLTTITFTSKTYIDTTINNLRTELTNLINTNKPINGNATTVSQQTNGRQIDVNVDNDSIKITSNQLTADVFDDTQVRNDKGWSSAKISQEMMSAMHYKGQVATYNDLPTTGQQVGDCYNVEDTGDNYAWNGIGWDKLSGEYIAGQGIRINGKVIAAKPNTNKGINATNNGIEVKLGDGLEFDANGNIASQNKGAFILWKIVPQATWLSFLNQLNNTSLTANTPVSIENGFEDIDPLFTIDNPSEFSFILDGIVRTRITGTTVTGSYANMVATTEFDVGPQVYSIQAGCICAPQNSVPITDCYNAMNSRQVVYQPNNTNKIKCTVLCSQSGTINYVNASTDLRIYALRR